MPEGNKKSLIPFLYEINERKCKGRSTKSVDVRGGVVLEGASEGTKTKISRLKCRYGIRIRIVRKIYRINRKIKLGDK
jgi:hypothetical protein